MALLEINDVVVNYGPISAVKGVTIKVEEGQIVAILGANGAGKSSIIKAVGGVNRIAAGVITFNGEKISNLAPYKVTRKGILSSPEGRLIFRDLSVEENLMTGAISLKRQKVKQENDEAGNPLPDKVITRHQQVKENLNTVYELFPILLERKKQKASTLSGGEQQMLAIGRALMGSPKLLLLDEPSLGLAPLIIKDIFEVIKRIAKAGTTILIVEQNAFQTLKISDYAYLMELGKIKAEGKAEVLLADDNLIAAYLGGRK